MSNKSKLLKQLVTFSCNSCNTSYQLLSGDLSSPVVQLDICAACHPFYLGKLASESHLGSAEKLKNKFASGRLNSK